MITRIFTPGSILGGTLILITLGCGQPRVYFTTSTTVGLEAAPPMSDGSGVPRIMFGYKRAEVAFIPVCPVEKYSYGWKWLDNLFNLSPTNVKECPTNTADPAGGEGTQEGMAQQKSAGIVTLGPKNQQDPFHPPSTETTGPGRVEKQQDAYSTLGLFRLGLSWFGPAQIQQFAATGQAARTIQDPLPPAKP